VIYEGSTFGPRLETGHHVALREGLNVGENLRVGTLSDLQGDATIGNFVRLHSSVHIGKLSTLGDFVWIFPYTVLTNDLHPPSDGFLVGVTVEPYAVITTMCCIAPGIRIGARSLVAASSMVTKDVEPDTVVRGVPARAVGPTSAVLLRDGSGRPAYPWTRHYRRGYPTEVTDGWEALE
jgi:acetyltransferase-like isoleucine patch superfamily enzyme